MRVIPLTDHITQLMFFPNLFALNVYLVREEDGWTLIDTGMRPMGEEILQYAQGTGEQIRRIAITHAHLDHVGALDDLHERLPDAEILFGGREARFLAGDRSLDAGEEQGKALDKLSVCKTRPTRLLADGDRVGSLEVFETPGHTPGHLAYLDRRSQTLIVGDTFQTRGGPVVVGQFSLFFPFPAAATWNRVRALESAKKFAALHPEILAVGHGPALKDPQPVLQKAIARG